MANDLRRIADILQNIDDDLEADFYATLLTDYVDEHPFEDQVVDIGPIDEVSNAVRNRTE